jgi:hypothetical protein
MAWVASSRQTHDKASDDFPLKTDSTNLKKIGIDIGPVKVGRSQGCSVADRAVRCLNFKLKQGTRAFLSDDPNMASFMDLDFAAGFEACTEQTTALSGP